MSTRLQRTADKSLNQKHAKILKDCLQQPENKNCADCKRKDPRWASWNLGIFVCINCSGVHRSMGTHISRVKSVDLDNWTPEQVENMVRWGNGKANVKCLVHSTHNKVKDLFNIDSVIQRYWEAKLKNSKLSERATDRWIRSKYEAKKWAMNGPIPDPDTLNDNTYLSESTSEKKTSEEMKNDKSPKIQNKGENNTFDLFLSAPQSPSSNIVSSQQHQQKNPSKLHGSEFFSIGKQSTFTSSIISSPQESLQPSATTTSRPTTPNNNSSGELSNHHNTLKSSIMSLYNSPNLKPTTTVIPQSIPGLGAFNISPHGSNLSLNSSPSSTTTNGIALDSKNLMMPQGSQYFTTFPSSSQKSLSSDFTSPSSTIETKSSSKHNDVFDDLLADFPQYK